MPILLLKSVVIWAAFIPLAILNGGLREKCLVPLIGSRLALPLSGLLAAGLFLLLAWGTLPWLGPLSPAGYRLLGLGWLALTVLFEFLFGRLVANKGWRELLAAYNPMGGNLWLLVLLTIALSPWWAARLRGLIP